MQMTKRAVGSFSSYAATELSLNEMKRGGFDMDKISIIGRDIHHSTATIGSLANLITGIGSVYIPSIGQVMLAGVAATAIVNVISGSFIGPASGSLAIALINLGIPASQAKFYSDRVFQGNYIVVIDGIPGELALARMIFTDRGVRDWLSYDIPRDSSRTALIFSTSNAIPQRKNPMIS